MSREDKIIDVKLIGDEENDYLVFDLEEEISVDLNSENSQNSLKNVFSKILENMLTNKIKLKLKIESDYSKGLYRDVCMEYINQLNRELLEAERNLINTFDIQ